LAADYEDALKYSNDVVKLHYSIEHRRSYLDANYRRANQNLNAFQAPLDNDDYDLD
jgi:protein tyrosine phosphatase